MLGESIFSDIVKGTCLFCHAAESIIHATDEQAMFCSSPVNRIVRPGETLDDAEKPQPSPPMGVCDVCSFALGHAWNRAMGRHVVATTPRFARTYVLVPRLPDKRPAVDISSYQFLVTADGSLPWFESGARWDMLPALLEREYGCKTWTETMRRCYLGFASGGDFSEVVLAWAWGRSLVVKDGTRSWKTFAELLATPSPEAGFHLGIMSGFESLMWRKEAQSDSGELCISLPTRTMKYIWHYEKQELKSLEDTEAEGGEDQDDNDDEDDAATLDFYRSSMSPAELTVVSLLDEARKQREEEAQEAEDAKTSEEEHGFATPDDEPPDARPAIIPPGFARPRTVVESGERRHFEEVSVPRSRG